jgi:DNA-binding response OmpR family regulator
MAKILIVEDDLNIARALAIRIKAAGHELMAAYDAIVATSIVLKQQPDLVVLDISLPGGDGFIIAERIQKSPLMVGIPIIFLTASKQPGLREKAMRLGAAAFFEKPYEAAELLAAIEAALSGSGIGSL